MWHRLPVRQEGPARRARRPSTSEARRPPRTSVRVPAGRATLGAEPGAIPFGWDNEFPARVVDVPAFEIDVHDVTNRDYLEFVEAGGYERRRSVDAGGLGVARRAGRVVHPRSGRRMAARWFWRGMWERVPLPMAWPVYVSHAEASAYARWRGQRLPTEAEFHRAAYGTPEGRERRHPWGDEPPDALARQLRLPRAPIRCRSARFPRGASAWGVHDLVGNGWEWTSTRLRRLPGIRSRWRPTRVYSADFFDGKHFVMKGASPATATRAPAASFRNWFRGNYPVRLRDLPLREGLRMTLPSRIAAPPEEAVRDVRRGRAARPAALAAPAPVEVPLRRARLGPLRGDLPAAVVPDHARRGPASVAMGDARWSRASRAR